jgi:anthranilate phosphoribosyltransferase
VLGVYDPRYMMPLAGALRELGTQKSMVVHSDDGLDELSISSATEVVHVSQAGIVRERVAPEDFGLTRAPREAVVARDLEHAVKLVREVIDGTERGAPRDMTLLTAGAALYVGDAVRSLREGVELARATIDAGKARATLDAFIARSRQTA